MLDGTARLTAAIAPIADRLSATVRRYTVRDVTLDELVARDALSAPAAAFLWALVQQRSRIVISGEPGAGKTTLAAALLAAGARESLHPVLRGDPRARGADDARRATTRCGPPGLDGTGEISLRDLVKFVLAMRPDRIVVGEVRGAEAFELTRAINAGCGFMCTVHANSAPDALERARERGADGRRERDRAHRAPRLLAGARPRRARRPRRRRRAARARCAGRSPRSPRSSRASGEEQTYEPIFVRDGLRPAARVDRRAPARARDARRSRAAARDARPRPRSSRPR